MKRKNLRKLIRQLIKEQLGPKPAPGTVNKWGQSVSPIGGNPNAQMGYNCGVGGVCVPVAANSGVPGIYATLEECQNSCIGPPPGAGGAQGLPDISQAIQEATAENAPPSIISGLKRIQNARTPQQMAQIAQRMLKTNPMSTPPRGATGPGGTAKKPFWETRFGKWLWNFLYNAAESLGSALGGSIIERRKRRK